MLSTKPKENASKEPWTRDLGDDRLPGTDRMLTDVAMVPPKVELPGWGPDDWVKPGSCLAELFGLEGHICGGLDYVKTLEKQHKQLTILFRKIVMKAKNGNGIDCRLPLRNYRFCSGGCEKYENDRGSSLLSAKMRKNSKNVRKILRLLSKMFSAVPERTKEELESILGKKFMGYASGNISDFERQKQKGLTVMDNNAVDENDEVHRVMMEVEPLLEAPGKRNWRSIVLTQDEFPCHCLLQTWWYPGRSNLVLILECGELLSMGLPDSSQPITIVVVGVMVAIRWLEAHVVEGNRQEAPKKEQLQGLDCLKDSDLFEIMCRLLNIPMGSEKDMRQKTTDAMV